MIKATLTTPDNFAKHIQDLCEDLESTFDTEEGITYEVMNRRQMVSIFIINPKHGFYDAPEVTYEDFKKSDGGQYIVKAVDKFLGDHFTMVKAGTSKMMVYASDERYEVVDTVYLLMPKDFFQDRPRGTAW